MQPFFLLLNSVHDDNSLASLLSRITFPLSLSLPFFLLLLLASLSFPSPLTHSPSSQSKHLHRNFAHLSLIFVRALSNVSIVSRRRNILPSSLCLSVFLSFSVSLFSYHFLRLVCLSITSKKPFIGADERAETCNLVEKCRLSSLFYIFLCKRCTSKGDKRGEEEKNLKVTGRTFERSLEGEEVFLLCLSSHPMSPLVLNWR